MPESPARNLAAMLRSTLRNPGPSGQKLREAFAQGATPDESTSSGCRPVEGQWGCTGCVNTRRTALGWMAGACQPTGACLRPLQCSLLLCSTARIYCLSGPAGFSDLS